MFQNIETIAASSSKTKENKFQISATSPDCVYTVILISIMQTNKALALADYVIAKNLI